MVIRWADVVAVMVHDGRRDEHEWGYVRSNVLALVMAPYGRLVPNGWQR